MLHRNVIRLAGSIAVLSVAAATAAAQVTRGSATGQTTAKGYDHPNEYITMQDVKPAPNMYPVIQHSDQDKAARDKLAALQKKYGKKPNILIFLMDDVGYMDPGFNGGGAAVGQDTPTMDELAYGGLVLSSAYSTPSCSPSRATIHTGQKPLQHGLLRPPMYSEPGGLSGSITLPELLKKQGYVTQGVGKWHMGENQGCRRTPATMTTSASSACPTCTRNGATSTSIRKSRCPRRASP